MLSVGFGGSGLGQDLGSLSGASVLFLACGMGEYPCRQPGLSGQRTAAIADGNMGSSLGHSIHDTCT